MGRPALDVDSPKNFDRREMFNYAFPYTLGFGLLAAPMAMLPLNRFIDISSGTTQGDYEKIVRNYRQGKVDFTDEFLINARTGRLGYFSSSAGKQLVHVIKVGRDRIYVNGAVLPVDVDEELYSHGRLLEQRTYTLVGASFGRADAHTDLKTLGMAGLEALDSRLQGPKAVSYTMGDAPVSEQELRRLQKLQSAGAPTLADSRSTSIFAVILFAIGAAIVALGGYLTIRSRRSVK